MATLYSLRNLGISPGQSKHEELELELAPYVQAGVAYASPVSAVPGLLDVTMMTEGLSFRLRFQAELHGPCARCLEDATLHVNVDAHAVHDSEVEDDQLRSEWVDDDEHELDVTGWAQEEVGVRFPNRLLCRKDCRGLCDTCGIDLNQVDGVHTHDKPSDSRWDALRTLQLGTEEQAENDAADALERGE
ncbi:MAG: hypothetical protein JWM25_265 [Thermoleophilia bacterium]|nr:hypothetical protein [Thermoleophilia bacterium]MCZ4495682.1 hypothetical protein [Thermoleophilia bacterium]